MTSLNIFGEETEYYVLGKEYVKNAIEMAYLAGHEQQEYHPQLQMMYALETLDDMIRGDESVSKNIAVQYAELIDQVNVELEMELRDKFALIAAPHVMEGVVKEDAIPPDDKPRVIAEFTYKVADAMIAERNKQRETE